MLGGDHTALDADLLASGVCLPELCIVSQAVDGEGGVPSAVYPGLMVGV